MALPTDSRREHLKRQWLPQSEAAFEVMFDADQQDRLVTLLLPRYPTIGIPSSILPWPGRISLSWRLIDYAASLSTSPRSWASASSTTRMMSLVRTVFLCKVMLSRAPETFSTFTVVGGFSGAFCLGRTVFPTAIPASSRFRPLLTIR